MIFLTVGTQLPFDRLTKAVDQWCQDNPAISVFGQLADPGPKGYRPINFEWQPFIDPEEFNNRYNQSNCIVAHAGMGSIISALTQSKPILILPRRAEFREHRNDHQMATAKRFKGRAGISTAFEEADVAPMLDALQQVTAKPGLNNVSEFAEPRLLNALREFILD